MSYDLPERYTYSYDHDFGAGTDTFVFEGPPGKKGLIRDVQVCAYETFTNTTLEAVLELGTTNGGAELVNMGMGTLADNNVQHVRDTAADFVLADIAADAVTYVTCNAPTGGTPAGKAQVHVQVDWY